MSDHQIEAMRMASDALSSIGRWMSNPDKEGSVAALLKVIPLASLLSAKAELEEVKKRIDFLRNRGDKAIDEVRELDGLHQARLKECIKASETIKQLRSELALANDAADKGKAGRELGTALEGCVEENKQLRAGLSELKTKHENLAKYARETWEKYAATQADNASLTSRLSEVEQTLLAVDKLYKDESDSNARLTRENALLTEVVKAAL